jgi:hypothetical protein
MGLTIHYRIALKPEDTADGVVEARKLTARARQFAQQLRRQGRVDGVGPLRADPALRQHAPFFLKYLHPEHGWSWRPVFPLEGWLFLVEVGPGCETLRLGLCRYPVPGRNLGRRRLKQAQAVWRLEAFCKTQYASLHGWEHFRRCHLAVLDLVDFWRTFGARVHIADEGGYWPRGSERALRRSLGELNGAVAGLAGALKDAATEGTIESPIFSHPQFERLEAEGGTSLGRQPLRQAVTLVSEIRARL